MDFKNKIVVVTGAGSGIGRCVAQTYASLGANVIIAEKTVKNGLMTKELVLEAGGNAVFIETDISNPAGIADTFSQIEAIYGHVDILINNAGFGIWKSLYDISLEEWDNVINTNLRGTFLCSREAAKLMRKNGRGSIVNMASTRAFMSEPDSELYAASKGGIVSLTHALAASLAKDNIQVNCISPGWIQNTNYDKLREIDHMQHFSNRVGKPEDIAKACLYLTQPGNEFINGQNISIDGGMAKKMIYQPD